MVEPLYPPEMASLSVDEFLAALPSLDAPFAAKCADAAAAGTVLRYAAAIADGRWRRRGGWRARAAVTRRTAAGTHTRLCVYVYIYIYIYIYIYVVYNMHMYIYIYHIYIYKLFTYIYNIIYLIYI